MNPLLLLMHDTASPLGRIKNYSSLIEKSLDKNDLTRVKEYLDRIEIARTQLKEILDAYYIKTK